MTTEMQDIKNHEIWLKSRGKKGKRIKIRYADFSNMYLKGTNFSYAIIQYSNFSEANLEGANFSYGEFTNSNFLRANLDNADFSYADFANSNFLEANFEDVYLEGTYLKGANIKNIHSSKALRIARDGYVDNSR